jgi:hypothetical protein
VSSRHLPISVVQRRIANVDFSVVQRRIANVDFSVVQRRIANVDFLAPLVSAALRLPGATYLNDFCWQYTCALSSALVCPTRDQPFLHEIMADGKGELLVTMIQVRIWFNLFLCDFT